MTRALVKIGFYYYKQHLRSNFNYLIYIFISGDSPGFFAEAMFVQSILFILSIECPSPEMYLKLISFVRQRIQYGVEDVLIFAKYRGTFIYFSSFPSPAEENL